MEKGQDVSLICGDTKALPRPTIQWFKLVVSCLQLVSLIKFHRLYSICLSQGDEEVEIKNDKPKYYAINTDGGSSELAVHYAKADAVYKCRVSNWAGHQEKKFKVSVNSGNLANCNINFIFPFVKIVLKFSQERRLLPEL